MSITSSPSLALHALRVSVVSLIVMVVGLMTARPVTAATPGEAARGLVQRLVGNRADQFVFAPIPKEDGRDVFELESRDGKIVVRGTSGVAMASGLNWYLKHSCHCHVSLWGNNLLLPNPLPIVPDRPPCTRRGRRRRAG